MLSRAGAVKLKGLRMRALGLMMSISALLVFAACSSADTPQAAETATTTSPSDSERDTGAVSPTPAGEPVDEMRKARFSTAGWETDFSIRNVNVAEIFSGGPPKDGIPSIDRPQFITVSEADEWLEDRESVQIVSIDGQARAYPTQILMWHEIVNDELAGVPISVTYCPLCNTAIVFERTIPDVGVVELGVSGNLYNSAMIMYDRTTESWFWQVSGMGIVGQLTDVRLTMVPSTLTSWAEFKQAHPDGDVLSRNTGFSRAYGNNPYVSYDSSTNPFLFEGRLDQRLLATERVATVELAGESAAFPFSALLDQPVIHETVGGQDLVVFYRSGTASPLDAGAVSQGRDVGSTGIFVPVVDGEALTFEWDGSDFVDQQTASRWSLLGQALSGPLAGSQLEPVVHGNHFWFSWAVYQPKTRIVTEE